MRRCTALQEKQGEGCVVIVDCHVEGGHAILPLGIYLGLLDYKNENIYYMSMNKVFQLKNNFENTNLIKKCFNFIILVQEV